MKRNFSILGVTCLAYLMFFTSCNQTGTAFNNKADSLSFAKAYFDQYPEDNKVTTKVKSDSGAVSAVQPLNWEEVLRYRDQYDKQPLIYNIKGDALKGFTVDASGYNKIKSNNLIKGLYLRLARKDDGAFTIMLLGIDGSGKVLGENQQTQMRSLKDSTEDTDFDNIDPCPANCPENFQ